MEGFPLRNIFNFLLLLTVASVSSLHAEEAEWIWANGSSLEQPIAEGEICLQIGHPHYFLVVNNLKQYECRYRSTLAV